MSLVDGRFRKHLAPEVPLFPNDALSAIDVAIFDASAQIDQALTMLEAQEAERFEQDIDFNGEDIPLAFLRGALAVLAGTHGSLDFLEMHHKRLAEAGAARERRAYTLGPESLTPARAAS